MDIFELFLSFFGDIGLFDWLLEGVFELARLWFFGKKVSYTQQSPHYNPHLSKEFREITHRHTGTQAVRLMTKEEELAAGLRPTSNC